MFHITKRDLEAPQRERQHAWHCGAYYSKVVRDYAAASDYYQSSMTLLEIKRWARSQFFWRANIRHCRNGHRKPDRMSRGQWAWIESRVARNAKR